MNDRPMHVLFVAGWYPYEGHKHFGVFIQEHAEAVKNYVDLSVVHLRVEKSYRHFPWAIEIREHDRGDYAEYELILYIAIRRFGLHDKMVRWAYDKVVRKIRQQKPIDLIHLNVRMHLTKFITEVPSLQNIPIVVTEHFSYYHTGVNQLPQDEQKREKEKISRWFQNPLIKKVMPVSRQLGDVLYKEYGVGQGRIEIIGNVANPVFHYVPQQREKEKINIALVANWGPSKNPLLFLKAVHGLPAEQQRKLHIDWIGVGEKLHDVHPFLQEYLPDLDVTFYGVQPKQFIASVFQQSNFFVHPTNYENLPCVIIESLCCGTPVVSNAVNGVPELIDESNGLLSEAGNVEQFRNNLAYMVEHSDHYDREAIASRAWALYSMESIGSKIFGIYSKVL